jgi:hypothetical protein
MRITKSPLLWQHHNYSLSLPTNALPLLQNFTMQAKLDRVVWPISYIPPNQEGRVVAALVWSSNTFAEDLPLNMGIPPRKAMSIGGVDWGRSVRVCYSQLILSRCHVCSFAGLQARRAKLLFFHCYYWARFISARLSLPHG